MAPIGRRLLSVDGLAVMAVETLVFAPLLAWGPWPRRSAAVGGRYRPA